MPDHRPNPRPVQLTARYVFPVAGPPVAGGRVTIQGGRIAEVAPSRGGSDIRDLGNVAILPGLVNAHVHLDFSDLAAPLGEPGIGFADWVRSVLDYRRRTAPAALKPDQRKQLGLRDSIACGVTALGDIAQPGSRLGGDAAIHITSFQELIAPTAERVPAAIELATEHITRCSGGCRPGLSPHAPYSTHPELLAAAIRLSRAKGLPVAMHLAESVEELEFLRHGSGPLRVLLEELGAWEAASFRPGTRPMDFLRLLGSAQRGLVIHGNYLDDEEIAFLGANADCISVVYCPRTHAWFGHRPYPLQKMLSAGATVALGTDGRGSAPDLNLLSEMRRAAQDHPAIALDGILRMATFGGAAALGRAGEIGTIEAGKWADLTIVALPQHGAADPHELIFDSMLPAVASYFCGVERCLSPDLPNRRPSSSSTSVNETPQ